jgi:hypothetical protein
MTAVDLAYINRSVDAAFALVMRDKRAWDKFDLSVEGFYRSFLAILVVAPMNIVTDIIATNVVNVERLKQGKPALTQAYGMPEALFSTITFVLQWMIFPIAMIFVLRFLGLTHRYAPLIVAHNWGTIVVYLFSLVPFLLYASGIVGAGDVAGLYMIVLVFTLYYRYYTAETALDAGWSVAASVALLGFVLQIYYQLGLPFAADLWLPTVSQ